MPILRTLLFVPGNQERRLERARSVPADALILDLEDSVPPAEKESARKMVAASVGGLASGRQEIFVRINSLATPYARADIQAIVTKGLRGICLPKSESASDVQQADALLTDAEKRAGLSAGSTGLLPLVETPKGILNVYEIATSSPRVLGVNFGAEDYALEMGVTRTKEGAEIYYPRIVIGLTCHAANVLAIDCVYTDVRDKEGLLKETRSVRQMGFQGKMVIHPDQVDPVNQIFTPSEEEVAYARRVVQTFEVAVSQGLASTALDGKMVDAPVAERARNLLALSELIAIKGRTS